jgi:hypothetical protein
MAQQDIILRVSLDGAKEEIATLERLQKQIQTLSAEKKRLNQQEKELVKAINESGVATKKQNETLEAIRSQQVKNNAALKANKAAYRENERAVISNTKAKQAQKGSIIELREQLKKNLFAYDRLSKAERENEKIGGALQRRIASQTAALKKLEGQTGRNQRNVGNYSSALKKAGSALRSFAGALGITAGIAGFVAAMKNAVKITKDFEQGNANLAAVLGKSRDEIGELTEDAKRLGASTSFSATQVSKLQTEFAKLGFNEKEILNATEATLDLAAATGSELSEAAAVAGATLGGFGLDATETQRIVDVMAKSFSTSALDLEKFRESMKLVAPVAKAVGVDLEETTALLGTLASNGIAGSNAGTALRASFTKLNEAGLSLDEGLKLVSESTDKLGTAKELVGQKAASAFLILAEGTKTTAELEVGLNNAGGAAEKMADEQLDTLEGQTKILNSAWEGLVLSLLSGDSAFNSLAKSIVEGATGVLTFFTNNEKLSDSLEEERSQLFATEAQLLSSNTTQEERIKIIQGLQKEYPELLGNLEAEKVSNEELVVALKQVNDQLVNRIIIARQQEKIDEQNEKVADAREKQLSLEVKLRKQIGEIVKSNTKLQEISTNADLTELEKANLIVEALDKRSAATQALSSNMGSFASVQTRSESATEKLAGTISALNSANSILNKEQESINNLLSEKQELTKSLGIEEEKNVEITEISTQASYGGIVATKSLIEEQEKLKKLAEEMPETTEAEIIAKNRKIKAIDDEISRLKNLGVETKAQQKEATKVAKEANKEAIKAIDDKIKLLEIESQQELAKLDENNEKKFLKEQEYLDKIGALRLEKAKLSNESLEVVQAETDLKKEENRLEEEERLKGVEEDNIEFKKQIAQEGIDIAGEAGQAIVEGAKNRADREKDIELAALNAKLEAGTISQEEFEAEKLAIEKKAFDKKKKLDLAILAIDLAKELSAIAVSAAGNPANAVTFGAAGVSQAAVLSGIAIARNAVQAGIISSQKFADGGVIHGASHANGGVKINVGGSGMIEAEGGEAIINKRSTAKHLGLLSAINQDGGGVALTSPNLGSIAKFQNGGIASPVSVQTEKMDLNDLEARITAAVGSIKVQNVASETTGVANRVQQIEDSASF